jgi:Glycosyl-transferase for dystroglycan
MDMLNELQATHSDSLRHVDFHLVYDGRPHESTKHYPHNFLRNIAVDNALTDLVLNVDADFIPSFGSHDLLLDSFKFSPELNDDHVLLILPAFERKVSCEDDYALLDASRLPATKPELLQYMDLYPGVVDQFHKFFKAGHGPTDYERWYSTSEIYRVDYMLDYEPYFVIRKSPNVPPFWEHFTGFGKNKLSWVEEVALSGFQFYVSPEAFLIHINHDYMKQEVRAVRPFILDEYAQHFNVYLKSVYGKSFWEDDALSLLTERQKANYVDKVYRICKKDTIDLAGVHSLSLGYQCQGKEYNAFVLAMHSMAAQLPEPVGRREFPIAANSSVLVLGNSHTRLTIKSLLCQYSDKVIDYDDVLGFASSRVDAFSVRFDNNSTIFSLTNNPVVYSPHWVSLVENIVGRPLRTFDAIILGKFNKLGELDGMMFSETLSQAMRGLKQFFDYSNSTAPTLLDIVDIYNGPVVYVSMFATQGISQLNKSIQVVEALGDTRNNLSVIDGRKYIDILGLECGTDDYRTKGKCLENVTSSSSLSRPAHMKHRCVGKKGGYPDLIAWELAEILNQL